MPCVRSGTLPTAAAGKVGISGPSSIDCRYRLTVVFGTPDTHSVTVSNRCRCNGCAGYSAFNVTHAVSLVSASLVRLQSRRVAYGKYAVLPTNWKFWFSNAAKINSLPSARVMCDTCRITAPVYGGALNGIGAELLRVRYCSVPVVVSSPSVRVCVYT